MVYEQAKSLATWMQKALGNEYFVALMLIVGTGQYKVSIYKLESQHPSVVLYNAVSLVDGTAVGTLE